MSSIDEVRRKGAWLFAVGILALTTAASGDDWSRQFAPAARFHQLQDFDYEAALDRETRLVWEIQSSERDMVWDVAKSHCASREVGGRLGWRLPAIEELASLVDPDELAPALPAGHPFLGVLHGIYWSSTSSSLHPASALIVNFELGFVSALNTANEVRVRCVRGGPGFDG
ncbi:MAG TPA: DUF1566 domain-containing protein [Thermoanaerobaculia bacterium]|nr:DUF1566 domain-containing protein [Thermoanaerobaculia bacterium]